MKVKKNKYLSITTAIILLFFSISSARVGYAITVNPTFTGFDANQQDVLNAAITRWTTMIGAGTNNINFIADNTIGPLAETSGFGTNAQGQPSSATIRIRENAHNWTTGAPIANGNDDALDTVMHEVGHAIGWSVLYNNFASNVQTVSGNRFYDLNGNGTFNGAADFNLIDAAASGTHASANSGDLMQPTTPAGQRHYPTLQHAGVLTDAFDYGVMLDGFGGPAGFGELAMGRNDDGSSNLLPMPFTIDLFGNEFNSFFINNNGNLTFNQRLSGFTPVPFPVTNQPMIAPYWGDVDTRCFSCGEVYVASPNADTVVVTWDNVGYYNQHSNITNDFQVVLRNRGDTGAGNFDVENRYDRLLWTTGDASGGSGGFGGTPAQAGFDAGDGTNFLALPGSFTGSVVNLQNTTNTPANVDIDGLWAIAIRNGALPGRSPDNPLLPTVIDDEWNFDFNIGDINDRISIDPILAIGYDYILDSGPNFASVLLPTGIGDNLYDLWLFDSSLNPFFTGSVLTGGSEFFFGAGGVDMFRILGIEISAGLDPLDTTAFVTTLGFVGTGNVTMRQIPITFDTDATTTAPIPEPSTWILLSFGLAGLVLYRRKLARLGS